VAIIGDRLSLDLPIVFTTMNDRLSISSDPKGKTVTLFYRPHATGRNKVAPPPVRVVSNPDLAEIIARLGGEGPEGSPALSFKYGEVVSILSELTRNQRISAMAKGTRMPAGFVLQELPGAQDSIYAAPVIPDSSRPQADDPGNVGMIK
jgi:hypothetical protein